MKTLVVITARGGSKGLPGKNIKLLDGKPMIEYTINAAREIFDDSLIYVSTDSQEIIDVAERTGLQTPFVRPNHLATDTTNSRDVLLHSIEHFKKENGSVPEIVVLLQPTSPLRTSTHIKSALKLYSKNIDMVISVKQTESNPYYVLFEENNNGYLERSKKANFTRRQDCPDVWEVNGAIYIINVKSIIAKPMSEFKKIKKFEMDQHSSLDIDNQLDFTIVEHILASK